MGANEHTVGLLQNHFLILCSALSLWTLQNMNICQFGILILDNQALITQHFIISASVNNAPQRDKKIATSDIL